MDNQMRLSGLGHLNLKVSNLERSAQFYREILAMEELASDLPRRIFLSAGNDVLTLEKTARGICSQGFHFGFIMESEQEVTRWAELLRNKGILIDEKVVEGMGRSIYFNDPDGYTIEIFYFNR